jgi:hypothetical protein
VASIGVAALLVGCANMPTRQLNEARTDVRVAEAVGARNHPHSAYHLTLAKDQIATAERWIDDGDRGERKRAKVVLQRASSDAELATAQAQAERLKLREKEEWAEVERLEQVQLPLPGAGADGDVESEPGEPAGQHKGHEHGAPGGYTR